MKKILALTLAAVMAAGMTTVAFAAPAKPDKDIEAATGSTHDALADNDDYDQVVVPAVDDDFNEMYVINDEGAVVKKDDKLNALKPLDGGDEIAIPVYLYEYWEKKDDEDTKKTDKTAGHDGWMLYTRDNEFDYDEELDVWHKWDVSSADARVDYIKYYENEDDEKPVSVMTVIVTIPENDSDKIEDLLGELKVGTTSTRAKNSDYSVKVDVTYAPDGTKEYYKDNFDGDEVLEAGKTGIVDFDTEAGEIDIEFGEEAMFTVNVNGQSRLNLAWTTRHDPEVAAMDESVNMDFITFTGNPSFNRTGTMYIYAADDTFLYQVVDGKLEKVDATYNEDYEAWEFRTRTLGEYVIADGEIDLESITDNTDDSSSTTDGGKVNPDTGR